MLVEERPVDSRITGSGVAIHVYRPTGRPEFGSVEVPSWFGARSVANEQSQAGWSEATPAPPNQATVKLVRMPLT